MLGEEALEVTTVSESVGMLQKLNALASIAIFQCLPMLYEFRFALFLCPQIERIASGSAVSKPRAFMRQMSSSLGSVGASGPATSDQRPATSDQLKN